MVGARLPKKLLFAVRLAAHADSRPISNYIEQVLGDAVRKTIVDKELHGEPGEKDITAWKVADQLFEFDEAKRLMSLATEYPHLLTQHEAQLWELIWTRTPFRTKPWPSGGKIPDPATLIDWQAVRDQWDVLNRVAAGQATEGRTWKVIAEKMTRSKGGKHGS